MKVVGGPNRAIHTHSWDTRGLKKNGGKKYTLNETRRKKNKKYYSDDRQKARSYVRAIWPWSGFTCLLRLTPLPAPTPLAGVRAYTTIVCPCVRTLSSMKIAADNRYMLRRRRLRIVGALAWHRLFLCRGSRSNTASNNRFHRMCRRRTRLYRVTLNENKKLIDTLWRIFGDFIHIFRLLCVPRESRHDDPVQ